jgi:hypothetical protein
MYFNIIIFHVWQLIKLKCEFLAHPLDMTAQIWQKLLFIAYTIFNFALRPYLLFLKNNFLKSIFYTNA